MSSERLGEIEKVIKADIEKGRLPGAVLVEGHSRRPSGEQPCGVGGGPPVSYEDQRGHGHSVWGGAGVRAGRGQGTMRG